MARKRPQLPAHIYQPLVNHTITANDIAIAIRKVEKGERLGFADAKNWYLVTEAGIRLPHRPIIALAATRHLKYQLISDEFLGPMDTLCRARLEKEGYKTEDK
jgi:hypothetical protein